MSTLPSKSNPFRLLYLILGGVSLGLGVLGVFLPLLPTTPFLLLTAFLWLRSSPRAYRWLMSRPTLGRYIRDYQENKVIPLQAKIVALVLMWGSMICCMVWVAPWWWLRILLFLVAVGVTFHILSYHSKK